MGAMDTFSGLKRKYQVKKPARMRATAITPATAARLLRRGALRVLAVRGAARASVCGATVRNAVAGCFCIMPYFSLATFFGLASLGSKGLILVNGAPQSIVAGIWGPHA